MIEKNCGVSCLDYIFSHYNYKTNISPDLIWAGDLAWILRRSDLFEVELRYYNSRLVNDYFATTDHSFLGFQALKKVLDITKDIEFNDMTMHVELAESDYIIFACASSVLNDDESMTGSHYIVYKKDGNIFLSPQKDKTVEIKIENNKLKKMLKDNGSWRILMRRKT